jgi:hypothetical protein
MANAVIDNAAASGDLVVVGGSPGMSVAVNGYIVQSAGAATITWKSGSTAKSGALPEAAETGVASGWSQDGWFHTAKGDDLILNVSAAVQVSGHVSYSLKGQGGGNGALGGGVNRLDFSLAKNSGYLPLGII